MKHRTSAESAAAFLALRGAAPHVPDRRILVNVATWTHGELVACVRDRIKSYEARGARVPHLTKIALRMLLDADEEAPCSTE